jgi:hypothetical protein
VRQNKKPKQQPAYLYAHRAGAFRDRLLSEASKGPNAVFVKDGAATYEVK